MVLGVFLNREDAEGAINRLDEEGYKPEDISIVMRDQGEGEMIADSTGAKMAEGAVSGATTGGVLGALAGLLVGTGVIPGLGALLIGGPIAAALGLTGAAATTISGAVTGALAGGLIGVLTNLGLSEEDAKVYEDRIREGGILVAVPARDAHEQEVSRILEDYGADQVKIVDNDDQITPTRHTHQREDEYIQRPAAYSEVRRSKKRS